MRILMLGDICGNAGVKIVKTRLKEIIKEKKIDFVIANGENAAENGKGITKSNYKDLISAGVDVITSGNHIWDQKDILDIIDQEKIIRPANFLEACLEMDTVFMKLKIKKLQ